ncbi:MAG: hypothetical protein ACYSRQ_00645 [Planctomycetota bacterium]
MDTKLQYLNVSIQESIDSNNLLPILTSHRIKTANLFVKTLLLLYTGGGLLLQASNQNIVKSRKGMLRCLVFFNNDELLGAVGDNGQTELSVCTQLKTGCFLYGSDMIDIHSTINNL